jgi:hypothetical protein
MGKKFVRSIVRNGIIVTVEERRRGISMNNSKVLTLGGAVALVIGLFLPIFTVMGINISLFSPGGEVSIDGIVILVCAILAGILALLNQTKWAVVPALISLGLLVWNYINIQDQLGGGSLGAEQAAMVSEFMSVNFLGWAVMGIGALLILVGGLAGWKKTV